MTSRLQNLHSLYTDLNNAYCRLPLVNRRYLYGNHTQTTQQVGVLARAKLVLAATFQWLPPVWNYNVDNFAATMEKTQRKGETEVETEDELCPIWLDFFSEMVELDRLLMSDQEGISPQAFGILFIAAEEKYGWLYALYQMVLEKGGWEAMPNGVDQSNSMIFIGWNRFCFRVTTGKGLEQAITTIRPIRKVEALNGEDRLHAGKSNLRQYFVITPLVDYRLGSLYVELVGGKGESDYVQIGEDRWRCEEPWVERYETPSYEAAYYSVEEAFGADELFDGRIYGKKDEGYNFGVVGRPAIAQTYDALLARYIADVPLLLLADTFS